MFFVVNNEALKFSYNIYILLYPGAGKPTRIKTISYVRINLIIIKTTP